MTASSLSRFHPERSPHAARLDADLEQTRSHLRQAYLACRADTLALASSLDDTAFYQQAHPDFSPIGWHLGHIGFTESLWILEHLAQRPCPFPQYRQLFAADGLPKAERQNLPDLPTLLTYLDTLRAEVLDYLAIAPLAQQSRLWHWLLQHESQHYETMMMVQQMHRLGEGETGEMRKLETIKTENAGQFSNQRLLSTSYYCYPSASSSLSATPHLIPAGPFQMGYDGIEAIDNEAPAYSVYLDDFYVDPYPVTQTEFQQFMAAGGYREQQYWSAAGWEWLQQARVERPLYWRSHSDDAPVCGVSWYEAAAYACFVGKRLPTEAEWEKAMQAHSVSEVTPATDGRGDPRLYNGSDRAKAVPTAQSALAASCGQVWEWTASWFTGYRGFLAYPYRGYSQAYFDGQHRVLRGGSWATRPWARRTTFRNWYHPHVRQVFAGFRCVSD
ncbi:MAG: ergothioneine biosynthesis protein EgtB [Leptolyngbya sp. SIO4C5]|nr:ergothioneine biosynthesis protein EgtB [Leptolyngbya sp. SIO4C5]